jgi:hypothetical protein
MTEFDSPTEHCDPASARDDRRDDDRHTPSVVATVEEHDEGPAECTLFPCNVDGVELMTTWITAQEGSFVDLESMR